MIIKTALSATLCLFNGYIPENSRLVTDRLVVDENHANGAALIKDKKSGLYFFYNAPGVFSYCNQREAAQIDTMSN